MYRSTDRYNINLGGQATYHDGHKIAFSLWLKWIRTVERGILAIKKTSAKTLQLEVYSVFFQKKKKKKKFDCKRKKTFFYLNFSSIAILENKDKIFYVNFVSWAYIYFG